MPLEFVNSEKAHLKLLENGYLYIKDKKKDEITMWKCDQCQKLHCRARIHTTADRVIKRMGEHTHAGDAARVEVVKTINQAKKRAVDTQDASHVIVTEAFVHLSQAAVGQMPNCDTLKRTIRNVRHETQHFPANPISLDALQIPDDYKLTNTGEPFLLYDSNDGENRIFIFSTHRNLQLLSQSLNWYADGTFKTVPPLFQQLYSIHGICNNNVIPAVFALLPSKTENIYHQFLERLKVLQPDLRPTTIMTDFESAAINAFKAAFPGAQQRGCFFHFNQCIYRNIQAHGLQHRYENDAEFALKMRMISALAFVPVDNVVDSFEQLCDNNNYPVEAQPVLDYFEDTWIGRPDRRQLRRAPRFSHEMWNCVDAVIIDISKTNNACEGWHRAFSEIIGASHPTIWKFLMALKNEQSLNEAKIEQYFAGNEPPTMKKRYRDSSKRIQRIVSDYSNRNLLDYLRGLAHNYGF